ncbi:MAG: GNAT family N-acetyltransferase [Bdellovibrionales bacterium]|nr:GNAT family N-acetyltransferase [Bdellovibrionales bacterium]
MQIVTLQNSQVNISEIENIFLDTSSIQSFKSKHEKYNFIDKWLTPYLENWPELVYLALHQNGSVMGYLTGCKCSLSAKDELSPRIASYLTFDEYFAEYPAHLHVNVLSSFQGQGLGKILIQSFISDLQKQTVKGLHAITSADSANISFYKKLGFQVVSQKLYKKWTLLLMGQYLFSN